MSLFKEAMADVGVSVEEFQDAPPAELMVEETVVSPADSPSAAVPITAPTETPITEEVVVAPIEDIPVTNAEVMVEQTVCEHVALQEKAEQLIALQTAMEEYKTIVRGTGFNGIDSTSAKLLQVQLREAARVLGISSKIGSMESFNPKGPREQHELATVSLEDIAGASKQALQSFIEIVNKIIEFIKRAGQNFFDGVTQVERAVDQLDAKLSKIKSAGGEGKFQCNAAILSKGGEYDREVSPDIHGLAHFASYAYPEAVVKFLDGMTKGVLKFDADGAGNEEIDAFFAQYSKPLQFLFDQQAEKDILPGGYSMNVSEHGLAIGIIKAEGDVTTESVELDVLPTTRLRKIVRDIKALLVQLKEIRPESEKISQSGKKLVEATKRAMAKGGKENEEVYNELAMKVGKMVQESAPRAGEIVDYVIRYAKAHCVAIGQQIKVIESGKPNKGEKEAPAKNVRDQLGEEYDNIANFIEEGNLNQIRTALRLIFNSKSTTFEGAMNAAKVTAKAVPELWERYEEKAFAREMNKDEEAWTEDYFDMQVVYLKTNFSKERFTHCANVAMHLGFIQ